MPLLGEDPTPMSKQDMLNFLNTDNISSAE